MVITAARPAYASTEGCYVLQMFSSFFLLNESPQKRRNVVWRHIWQDVGPDWEGLVHKLYGYPSRGFSRGSEKLSKKYAFSDFENFRPRNGFIMGRLTCKVPLIIVVAP